MASSCNNIIFAEAYFARRFREPCGLLCSNHTVVGEVFVHLLSDLSCYYRCQTLLMPSWVVDTPIIYLHRYAVAVGYISHAWTSPVSFGRRRSAAQTVARNREDSYVVAIAKDCLLFSLPCSMHLQKCHVFTISRNFAFYFRKPALIHKFVKFTFCKICINIRTYVHMYVSA